MPDATRALTDIGLFFAMAVLFLAPVYLFLRYRQGQAIARERAGYVARFDPWLPAVVAVAGAGVLAFLRLVS